MSALPADTSTPARIQISDFAAIGAANYAAGLGSAADRDWIAIDLVAGHAYRFEAALSGSGAQVSLRLADATGTTVGTAGTITGSGNAALAFTATTTGTYYIDIGSANGVVGSYDVVAIDRNIRPIATIETLTGGNDSFVAATGGTPQLSRGLEGNDRIDAGGVLLGQQGNDDLTAAKVEALLYGGDGNDTLRTRFMDTVIDGGRGNDTFISTGLQLDVDLDWLAEGTRPGGPLLTNVENVTAGGAADTIRGSSVGNRLNGGGGDDLIDGRGGDDILTGGDGDDTINGGTGADRIEGGDGADMIDGGGDNDFILGGGGDDVINGGAGDDYIVGGAGADAINGGDGADTISYAASSAAVIVDFTDGAPEHGGDAEGDTLVNMTDIIGSAFDDVITASSTSGRIIIGGAGADHITGPGNTYYTTFASYESSTADITIDLINNIIAGGEANGDVLVNVRGIIGGSGDDTINGAAKARGGAGNDTISNASEAEGGAGDDIITNVTTARGNDGDDVITGTSGNDVLRGDAGHDEVRGGAGNDRIYADAAGGDYLDGGSQSGGRGIAAHDTLIYETDLSVIIDLDQTTDNFGNTVIDMENVLTGAGNDHVDLGLNGYHASTGHGDDVVIVTQLFGNIDTGYNYDTVDLSSVTTNLNGLFLSSSVTEFGDLRIVGAERLYLGSGDDTITVRGVSWSRPELFGGDGNDILTGNSASLSAFRLDGGNGDDSLTGDKRADVLIGGSGTDLVDFSASTAGVIVDLISGTTTGRGGYAEGDVISGVENLTGSAFDDRLHGGDEANVFIGGDGDDILLGRGGADLLTGGNGADRFVYSATSQSIGASRDTITDFTRADGDIIDLLNIDANTTTAGNQAFSFVGTDAFSGTAGELRVTSSLIDSRVQADTDGDGIADLDILVLNVTATTFTASDFIL